MYLLFKSLHLFFLMAWFAGLFYLPRLYVNLALTPPDSPEHQHLLIMANKLYKFMTPWGIGAILFGVLTVVFSFGFKAGWVHGKLFCGGLLIAYHIYCRQILHQFQTQTNTRSHRWFRLFNELPVFVLIAAIYLVIYKPFSN